MYFAFAIKTRDMSVSRDSGKIAQKEMSKSFSCDYEHYNMVKSRQNVNFEEIDTEPSAGKRMNFDYSLSYHLQIDK